MKILQIASIIPTGQFHDDNPYVKNFIKHFTNKYNESEVVVAKPITYLPQYILKLKKNKEVWNNKYKAIDIKHEVYEGININYFPYISVGSIPLLHILGSYLGFLRNRKGLNEITSNVDVIHAHYLFPDGLFAYLLNQQLSIPYVLTLRQEKRFLKNKTSRLICSRIIEGSSACSTQSYQMYKELKEINIDKVEHLPTGIESYFFETKTLEKKVPKSKLNLISVCNLLPIKNLQSVILAIKKYDLQSHITYHIYGTGSEEEKLQKLVEKLDLESCITFMGRVDNTKLPGIYPHYDLFVQPSFKETFGLTYFEALACELPVILSENTGAYPLIKKFDVCYVVDPNSIASIGHCLKEIVSNPNQLKRKKIRAVDAAKIASWDTYINFYRKAYREATL